MTLDWVRKRTIADGRRVHGGAAGYTAWTPESAGESYYHIARRGNRWRVIVHVRWRANDESDRAIIAASHPTLAAAKAAVAGGHQHLLVRGTQATIPDVVHDRVVEQHSVLHTRIHIRKKVWLTANTNLNDDKNKAATIMPLWVKNH